MLASACAARKLTIEEDILAIHVRINELYRLADPRVTLVPEPPQHGCIEEGRIGENDRVFARKDLVDRGTITPNGDPSARVANDSVILLPVLAVDFEAKLYVCWRELDVVVDPESSSGAHRFGSAEPLRQAVYACSL